MATINGTPLNFGFVGTNGITSAQMPSAILQVASQAKMADVESARNGVGDIVTRGHYDQHDEMTLELLVAGTTLADAITQTGNIIGSLTPGLFVSISACTSMPGLVALWEVQSGAAVDGKNTDFKKLKFTGHKRAGIIAAST